MESIAWFANAFIELFKSGATIFAGWVAGIIPLVIVMMTAFNSLIKLIGEDKVNRGRQSQSASRKIDEIYDYSIHDFADFSGCIFGKSDVLYVGTVCKRKI